MLERRSDGNGWSAPAVRQAVSEFHRSLALSTATAVQRSAEASRLGLCGSIGPVKRLEGEPDSLLRTRHQLLAAGHSAAAITTMERRGALIRLRSGLYTKAEYRDLYPEDAHRVDVHAAHRIHRRDPGTTIVYSHESAAALHRLPLVECGDLKVRRTRASAPRRSTSTTVTTTSWLPLRDGETTTVGGIAVTSVPRTVADLLRTAGRDTALCVADAAVHKELCSVDELADALADPPSRFGTPRARRRLAEVDGLAESALETRSRLLFADAGLPEPELQVRFDTRLGEFRVDFFWRAHRVIGECDGLGKYLADIDPEEARRRLGEEKDRENELQALGYSVIRWRWRDLYRPHVIIERVRRALFADGRSRVA